MTAVSELRHELRHHVIEAVTCLICADSPHCTDPAFCRHDAAHFISLANRLLANGPIEVETAELGRVRAFIVTDAGQIRVHVPDGSTGLIHAAEVFSR